LKYAVIDMGSNTVRLCVYHAEGGQFHPLFSEKAMAGLAGYVKDGALSPAGIRRACEALLSFQELLAQFDIDETFVFATASLRNIANTEDAVRQITDQTGYTVDLISGREEAELDFCGSLHAVHIPSGILLDIGGGSTEFVLFEQKQILAAQSIPIGSLNLHTQYVRKFLPNNSEQAEIRKKILKEWRALKETLPEFSGQAEICGVGGTARAALKLINARYGLSRENRTFTAQQLHTLTEELCVRDKAARTRILRVCPDRVHTILPGLLILDLLTEKAGGKHITISRYGVREGYLCRQIEKSANLT
jgi:exopolyphosphatase/guanosine-5'-triphosphate,3'-diphosphate pyrophosphatase